MIPTLLRSIWRWSLRLVTAIVAFLLLAFAIGVVVGYTKESHCADASMGRMQGKILVHVTDNGLQLTDIGFHGKPEYHAGRRDTWRVGLHARQGDYVAILDCRARVISFEQVERARHE
ncbi:hypothetical protein FCJ61_16170 [Burkholderia metallica]|uniref:hypothetical protein n=1 Tax=Burkholderia metallica TaxID=488729 RepID=UPI00157A3A9B|nr:hypothetical protein [Burkholderia metallica]NTZ84493.1 hypothetical protein [Burkholderia metallica]